MENGVLAALGFVVGVAAVTAVGLLWLRRRDAERAEVVQAALAAVARAINDVLSDAEVRALAGWAYDVFGVSQYYSREEWVLLCLRLVREAEGAGAPAVHEC